MLKIIAGSYERLLYGFDSTPPEITPTFIYPSHLSCIKTLASSGKYLASGGTDEQIKLYDIAKNKEVGLLLLQHSGSITSLAFHKTEVLVSASEDGTIALYRISDWARLKTLSGHKGAVNHVAIHESGKLCLSVGKDATVQCWDLVRGLCARRSKIERGAANSVLWSVGCNHYALIFDKAIEIVDVQAGSTVAKIDTDVRINSAVFTRVGDANLVVAGFEDARVKAFRCDGHVAFEFETKHNNRVKDLDAYRTEDSTYLVTCSSDGFFNFKPSGGIKTWNLNELKCVAEYDAKCRVTCITFARPGVVVRKNAEQQSIHFDNQSDADEELLSKSKPTVVVQLEEEGKPVPLSQDGKRKRKFVKKNPGIDEKPYAKMKGVKKFQGKKADKTTDKKEIIF